jgi:hypothetical protein
MPICPRAFVLLLPFATFACDGKDDTGGADGGDGGGIGGGVGGDGGDGGDGAADGGDGGGDEATVSGIVTGPYSDDPNPNATVWAWNADGDEIEVATDGEGRYVHILTPGEWIFEPQAPGDCYGSGADLSLAAGDEVELDLHIDDCITADKPNLYLYPARPTPTRVQLELDRRQRVVASDPPYGQGWRGVARPDGAWRSGDGSVVPFLFYEVSLAPWQRLGLDRRAGWCVDGLSTAAAAAEMGEILAEYGFNAAEVADFVEAWEIDLPPADSYAVFPMTEVDHLAGVHIDPPLALSRLWLIVDEGARCPAAEPPPVVPFDRSGPHAVEWGVVLRDLVR